MNYQNSLIEHFSKFWNSSPSILKLNQGPIVSDFDDFCILEYPPSTTRNGWTYSTCGIGKYSDKSKIEFHMISSDQNHLIGEILTYLAYYHLTKSPLGLGHTIPFGIKLTSVSVCDYGFISLPYLDGPRLEDFIVGDENVKCYWMIPITENERKYKSQNGVEALEELFDSPDFDFDDLSRKSLIN